MIQDAKMSLDGFIYTDCNDHWYYKVDPIVYRQYMKLPEVNRTYPDSCWLCDSLQRVYPGPRSKDTLLYIGNHDHLIIGNLHKDTSMEIYYPDARTMQANRHHHTVTGWPGAECPLQNQRTHTQEQLCRGNYKFLILSSSTADLHKMINLSQQHIITLQRAREGAKASAENTIAIAEESLQNNPGLAKVIILTYAPYRQRTKNPNHIRDIYQAAGRRLNSAHKKSPYQERIILDHMPIMYEFATNEPENIFDSNNVAELTGNLAAQAYTLSIEEAVRRAQKTHTQQSTQYQGPTRRFRYWNYTLKGYHLH